MKAIRRVKAWHHDHLLLSAILVGLYLSLIFGVSFLAQLANYRLTGF